MIGIFGGTFDPIHYGHLRSALEVKEIFNLTQVRLIPSAQPPHRLQPLASAALRLQMLELAISNQTGLVADDRELKRVGQSYMIDTLQSLRHDFPQQSLVLFMGSDAFNTLTSWHCWQDLFTYAHIVVLTRPGFVIQALDDFFATRLTTQKQILAAHKAGKLLFQSVTQLDISATAIRRCIAEGKNPGFLLPDVVITTIKQNQLYQIN
ncbi:nicotinate-nucleotide adenylyltransferase [Crenothrix polyspora]|uniref:Probable nicotinate-nucleotide adenylyltransferase n=1 Tax=Crenothrix polyspora TaxID=360316 RepID=A0A1R4HA39_9GAMM|nr:nicotinate-nucleotide adenylyltransferase [Crenothrix polyspora]SJM92891.1 putative nicotinate-nucleotide adenylyltransferase [Crenothrix polyspora]